MAPADCSRTLRRYSRSRAGSRSLPAGYRERDVRRRPIRRKRAAGGAVRCGEEISVSYGISFLKGDSVSEQRSKCLNEPFHIGLGERGGERQTQAGGAFGHGGRAHGQHIEALAAHILGLEDGLVAVADDYGQNVALRRRGIAPGREGLLHGAAHVEQMPAPVVESGQTEQHKAGPCHLDRGQGGGEDQSAHLVDEVTAQRVAAHHKGSHRGQCLAHRAAEQIDVGQAALFLGDAQSTRSACAHGMGFVYIEQHIGIAFFQVHQQGQGGNVAVHAEDALRYDKDAVIVVLMLFEQLLQLSVVLMTVADAAGGRKADAVDDAGMHQFVGQDERTAVGQCGQDAGVHVIAAAEEQGGFALIEVGQQLFHLVVDGVVAREQA